MNIHQVFYRIFALTIALVMISACSMTPVFEQPVLVADIKKQQRFSQSDRIDMSAPDTMYWWKQVGGEELDNLVNTLLIDSLSLKEVRLRAQQAKEGAAIARSQRLPSAGVFTDISTTRRQDMSGDFISSQNYSAALSLDFSADIFGGLRASERAAKLNALAGEISVIAAEQTEIAVLAKSWISAKTLMRRLELAKAIAQSFQVTYDLTNERYAAGSNTVNASDVQIALQNLQTSLIDIPSIEADLTQQFLLLDEQLARMPGETAKQFKGNFVSEESIDLPLGQPLHLLRNRPDIAIAELAFLAAIEDVGAAKANLYPSLSLNASLTFQADEPSDLFDWDRHISSLANSLLAPIFQGGRLRSQVRIEQAQAQELAEAFARTTLSAVIDVELTLAELKGLEAQLSGLKLNIKTAKLSNNLVQERFQQGLTSILAVLETQRSLNSAQQNLILTEQAISNAKVDLYFNFGGNWTGQHTLLDTIQPTPFNQDF